MVIAIEIHIYKITNLIVEISILEFVIFFINQKKIQL